MPICERQGNAWRDTHQNQQLLFKYVTGAIISNSYDLDDDSAHFFGNYGKWCGLRVTGVQCQRGHRLMRIAPRNRAELVTSFQVQADL